MGKTKCVLKVRLIRWLDFTAEVMVLLINLPTTPPPKKKKKKNNNPDSWNPVCFLIIPLVPAVSAPFILTIRSPGKLM